MKIFNSLFLILVSLCISVNLNAQEFNKKNASGQKVGKWKANHENGKLRYIGQFEIDEPVDTFFHYFATGKLQSILIYASKSVAYATHFYDTGEMLAKGKYVNRKKDSVWLTFGADNIVVEKGNYVNGIKEGEWKTLLVDGSVSTQVTYKNDLKHGKYTMFFADGTVKDESNFTNGKLDGESTLYDTDGNKIIYGIYQKGKRVGDWIYYKENGEVDKTLIYKNGKLTNPKVLNNLLKDVDKFKGNRKEVLEFEDLRGTIKYE